MWHEINSDADPVSESCYEWLSVQENVNDPTGVLLLNSSIRLSPSVSMVLIRPD